MIRGRERDQGYDEFDPASHHDPEPLLLHAARVVIPWIALIAVVTVILTFWSEFQFESGRSAPSAEATATAEPSGTVPPEATSTSVPADEPHVRVKVDGLNLRTSASTDSDVIKKLPSGTILAYVESTNGWYHVRDEDGTDGWVAAGGSFTELVNP